jgi:hypothetical protein
MEDTIENGGERGVELYVRSLSPAGAGEQQKRVIERLQTLEERGHISEFTVTVWGKRIDISDSKTAQGKEIRRRLTEFEQWAHDAGVSLASFYRARTVESATIGDTITTITLPVMGLAEYVDDELTYVTPCTDGDTVHSVEDHLAELATQRGTSSGGRSHPPVRSLEGEP